MAPSSALQAADISALGCLTPELAEEPVRITLVPSLSDYKP